MVCHGADVRTHVTRICNLSHNDTRARIYERRWPPQANKRQSQRCELCGSWLGAGDADHVGAPMAVATASWVETASTRWGGLAVDTASACWVGLDGLPFAWRLTPRVLQDARVQFFSDGRRCGLVKTTPFSLSRSLRGARQRRSIHHHRLRRQPLSQPP